MFIIECPFCGPRDQSEFSYGGQAHISRPNNGEELSDQEWAEFVFIRDNPKGLFAERWVHSAGCRKFFNVLRDTATDRIYAIYKMGEPRPAIDAPGLSTPSGEPVYGSGNDGTKVAVDPTAEKESV